MSKLWYATKLHDNHFVIRSKHNVSLLYRTVGGNSQLVLPSMGGSHQLILEELHCGGVSGHFGPDRMFAVLSLHVWWPKMMANVCHFIRSCAVCQYAKDNT